MGTELTSSVGQGRLSGSKPQAWWPHQHCRAVLEASELSPAAEGSPDGGAMGCAGLRA